MTSKISFNEKENEILITEIPFEVNKSDLVRKIDILIRENQIPSVKEIRDDTDKNGLLITIICRPNINFESTKNYLLKKNRITKKL